MTKNYETQSKMLMLTRQTITFLIGKSECAVKSWE